MRTQISRQSGPHIPLHLLHLLQLVLLFNHLAIVIDCIEVPIHAYREIRKSGENYKANNMMMNAHCRSGHEEWCSSIPVHDPHGFSMRSRKELLFLPRSVKAQPKHAEEYPGNGQFGRRLPRLHLRSRYDMEHEKSHQLLEDSEPIPLTMSAVQNVKRSKGRRLWTAPPMERGPMITITVAQGEDADFSSIQQAVDSVPEHNTQRIVIRIHAGTYREKVIVPYKKPFITFHGDENGGTFVSWNSTASSGDEESDETKYETLFQRIGFNSSSALFGTMKSASVTILSDGFVAQHMVFQNSAPPPEPGAVGAQAVAFLIGGDRAAFYHCSFLGAQDTLYDYSGRHYYMNCYIQGSIDFIFGNGRSLFEGCHLHSIATSFGAIAAHQRLSLEDDTGFSFDRCIVTGSGTLFLGRAWSPYARIVFARTYLENIISAEGWSDFGDPQRQSTTFFGQYQLIGPGANLSHRAPWAKLLTDADVLPYLGLNFLNGGQWLGATWPNGTDRWPSNP
ncbi:unnamed protein product [Calypogeia fissa]